jgi:hypothetical protein
MRSDSDLHETRTNAVHDETGDEFRVSFESRQCGEYTIDELRRVANAVSRGVQGRSRWAKEPPPTVSGEPLYGACEYARSVLNPPLPWGALGAKAVQEFRDGRCYVYFIGADTGLVKIGVSNAPLERITTMQMGSPVLLRFLALREGDYKLEREYHDRFAPMRVRGEWFERCPEIEAEIERLNPRESPQ